MQGAGKSRLKRSHSDEAKAGLTPGKPVALDDSVNGAVKTGKDKKKNRYGLELVERWALR